MATELGLRCDSRRCCRSRYFHLQVTREIIDFGLVGAGIRVPVPRDCIGLRLVEVPRDDSVGENPADVVSENMQLIDRFPRTHADVSAQSGLSDVLPFIAVAVPLNKGLRKRRTSGRVDHMPRPYNPLAGTLTFKMARERTLFQRPGGQLVRCPLASRDA